MADSLEENFVLEGTTVSVDSDSQIDEQESSLGQGKAQSSKPTTTAPSKKRNFREMSSSLPDSAEKKLQVLQEAFPLLNVESEQILHFTEEGSTDEPISLLHRSQKLLRKKEKMLVFTYSQQRVLEILESHRDLSPYGIIFHGTGRKKEQLEKIRSNLKSTSSCVVVGVASRLAQFHAENLVPNVKIIAIDCLRTDAKKMNTLTYNESKLALKNLLQSITGNFDKIKFLIF
jgi:hypothetical protein